MSRLRWRLMVGMGVISVILAFLLRDVVYDTVIVPFAYVLWLGNFYYSAIPQWVLWSVLLAALFLFVVWNLIPDVRPALRKETRHKQAEGQVEALAIGIARARHGNYFKWQLANRLGRIARRMDEASGSPTLPGSGDEAVDSYLDAGLNHSFVDFPSPRSRFERAPRTALDLDPRKVADYLESRMENQSGGHG